MRDQAGRLYAAEAATIKVSNNAMTLKECQQFVDKVLARKYVQANYPWHLPIVVHDGRGRRNACATFRHWNYAILLPKWARNEFVILHEIAHHISRGDGHGPQFATCLLDLVRNVMGKEEAELLQAGFALHGVKVQGKNGPVKARCPKSKTQWLADKKAQRAELKERAKNWKAEQTEYRTSVETGEIIPCYREGCDGAAKGEVKILRGWRDKVQYQWTWKCPNDGCTASQDQHENRAYKPEVHGDLPIEYVGIWY